MMTRRIHQTDPTRRRDFPFTPRKGIIVLLATVSKWRANYYNFQQYDH